MEKKLVVFLGLLQNQTFQKALGATIMYNYFFAVRSFSSKLNIV